MHLLPQQIAAEGNAPGEDSNGAPLPFAHSQRQRPPPQSTGEPVNEVSGCDGCHDGTLFPESPGPRPHSHSIVLGGFELTSYTTRLTPRTEFVIRVEIRWRTS